MAVIPGTRLGVYEISAKLGEGGMGAVFRARDTKLDRDVAIKILPEAFAHDADRLARFTREAKTLAALNHPNIAAIYGLEESGPSTGSGQAGITALVMELVEGEDLSTVIARSPLPLSDALPIAKQIAEALEAAHEQGIVHRDLKPANIKLKGVWGPTPTRLSDGRLEPTLSASDVAGCTVKVLDFGLAKALGPEGASATADLANSPTITSPAMTQMGMILGTAAYMAPEQARGKVVDKRADIWAFGVVLYEMLTGSRAFEGEDVADVLSRVLQREPDFAALPADVPARVRQVLHACLQKDPKQRLGDMQSVRLALDGAFETAASAAPVAAPAPPTPPALWRRPLPVAVAAAVLATLALAVVSVIHFRETTPDLLVTRTSLLPPGEADWASGSQALSPDGRRLAFLATGEDGTARIWVRALDALTAQPLERTEGATGFFWSPDGEALAFFAKGRLSRIALAGGGALTLADGVDSVLQRGGSWGRDGTIVYAAQNTSGLMKVRADGGPPEAATVLGSGETSHRWPWFLPDGRHFLFGESTPGGGNPVNVWVGSLDSADRQRILTANSVALFAPGSGSVGHLLYVREETLVAHPFDTRTLQTTGDAAPVAERVRSDSAGRPHASVSNEGVLSFATREEGGDELVWLDRAGNPIESLRILDRGFGPFNLSPDGRTLAYASREDIWLYDVERQVSTRFTSTPGTERSPIWSPDGRTLYYSASRRSASAGPEVSALYRKPVSGMGPEEEVIDGFSPGSISPDGRFLAFMRLGAADRKLWILPDPGGPPGASQPYQLFPDASGGSTPSALSADYAPAWSPDGRWLAFGSTEAGSAEVYVVPFPGPGTRVRISRAGAGGDAGLQFSPDGRQILFVDRRQQLVAVDIAVVSGQLQVGDSHVLFPTPAFEMSLDGRRFLSRGRRAGNEPLTLVQNWTEGLKRAPVK